jgi:cardiolipin synthase
LPLQFIKKTEADGIRCATFNRFIPVLNAIQNYRDHRKIVVIDGKTAYTGGLNLADEYINKKQPFGHWKDTAVRLEGDAAWSFTVIFLETWYMATAKTWKPDTEIRESIESFYPWKNSPCPIQKADSFVLPFADSPLDDEHVTDHVYTQMITKAQNYVYIMTPYLIVDNSMVSALCTAAKSGVDIRIITPHRWDKRIVHFTTRSYYRELIKAGVRIYEYTPGFIHSKTFVSDDDTAVIGSANMDFRSLYLQFECGVWMYKTEAVTELRDDFLKTLDVCHEITAGECHYNVFTRFLQEICRLFAPLM